MLFQRKIQTNNTYIESENNINIGHEVLWDLHNSRVVSNWCLILPVLPHVQHRFGRNDAFEHIKSSLCRSWMSPTSREFSWVGWSTQNFLGMDPKYECKIMCRGVNEQMDACGQHSSVLGLFCTKTDKSLHSFTPLLLCSFFSAFLNKTFVSWNSFLLHVYRVSHTN